MRWLNADDQAAYDALMRRAWGNPSGTTTAPTVSAKAMLEALTRLAERGCKWADDILDQATIEGCRRFGKEWCDRRGRRDYVPRRVA